jgi:hypothetical protein
MKQILLGIKEEINPDTIREEYLKCTKQTFIEYFILWKEITHFISMPWNFHPNRSYLGPNDNLSNTKI